MTSRRVFHLVLGLFVATIAFAILGTLSLFIAPVRDFFLPYYATLVAAPTWTYMALLPVLSLALYWDQLGVRRSLLFLLAASVIGAGAELLGTNFGVPFGAYHYTDRLGAKILGDVPYFIPTSWYALGVLSYDLAGRLGGNRWARALGTALFMVVWDVSLDPAMNQGGGTFVFWTYPNGGAFFGMPSVNWVGWAVTSAVISLASRRAGRAGAGRHRADGPVGAGGLRLERVLPDLDLLPLWPPARGRDRDGRAGGGAGCRPLAEPIGGPLGGRVAVASPLPVPDRLRRASRFTAPEAPALGAGRRAEDRYLRRAFRHHSRTFSLATRLLPRAERLPVAVLYLYCRTVDTLADERVHEIGVDAAHAEMNALDSGLAATLAGRPPAGPHALMWRRLAEVHGRYRLPAHPLRQLLDGARWDLDGRPVETTADLLDYSDLVAGSVGAAMLPFLVRRAGDRERLEAPARALGAAMQITNILRDVGEDWRDLGRTYLPADALRQRGVDLGAAVPAAPPVPPSYRALVEDLMDQAERLYDTADAGIRDLRPAAQAGVRGAARMYREFLNAVRANGYDNLSRRAAVPMRRKLAALAGDGYARRRDRLATRTGER